MCAATFGLVTLVLLHPLPLDGSVWSEETRALAPRSVAPTLYGFGDSIEDWAAEVLDVAASIDIPVLVVCGQHDRNPQQGDALAAGLKHATFSVVEGAGHYVPVERPATLAAILRSAIASLSSYP